MIQMSVSEAARLLNATLLGDDGVFRGLSTDTRSLLPGNLFAALKGPNHDGHDHLEQARLKGAAAALVEQDATADLPLLKVDDPRLALGRLAERWRRRMACALAAVTGSNGKTTVKEMLASVLGRCGETLATRGNLNNDIGVPLTLLELAPSHAYAVIEMGANHPGEIAYLTELAAPRVGLITQCAPAHLEGFGSIEGVARAKGELFEGLPAAGTAVINADDDFAGLWRQLAGSRACLDFGLRADAEVRADWRPEADGSVISLHTPAGRGECRLALPGRHNVMNALATTAVALALDIGLDDIVAGLGGVRAVAGRLQVIGGQAGSRIINDSYNANPGSAVAAIDVLSGFSGRRWLVLGDMAELGANAEALHAEIGSYAAAAGLEALYAIGDLSRAAVAAFGSGARHFNDHAALNGVLCAALADDVTVLIKGSRSMHMEDVVTALTGEN